MNWTKIKFLIFDLGIWIAANWWILVVIAGFIAVAALYGQIQSCSANSAQKKLEKQRQEIGNREVNAAIQETIANVQENKVREKEIQANEKSNISNQAAANYNAVVNRDSGEFDTDFERTKRAYCADPDHKRDSLCQPVR